MKGNSFYAVYCEVDQQRGCSPLRFQHLNQSRFVASRQSPMRIAPFEAHGGTCDFNRVATRAGTTLLETSRQGPTLHVL
jgi:hypothetical protein